MIKVPKDIWPSLKEIEGLLFFAQKIEELLFHYSLDSYRVPALNTKARCKEILDPVGLVLPPRI